MRSSGRVSPAGLTWPHSPAIPVIATYAAPTDPASGKAVPAGAEAGFPGLSRYSPGGHSPLRAEPAFGDWRADLVCAAEGQAALLSCKEDKSRFLLPTKAQNKTAIALGEALVPRLCEMPPGLRQTLTLDNGSEMAQFKKLERATGLFTYFCRPHSPWQGSSNENEGGLLRQYFQKGASA